MLRKLADDLWVADHDQVLPGRFHFPTRMTVVRLPSGGLWLHSPVHLDDASATELAELGEVEHVVAPNRLHSFYCAEARERWPNAKHWAAEGLPEKRPDLSFDATLEGQPWGETISRTFIAGAPIVNENVFFHASSGSLIFPDLMFNFRESKGLMAAIVLRLVGVHGRLKQSGSWRFLFIKDRLAAGQSIRSLLDFPATRLVPCHGEILEGDRATVRAQLEAALAWSLRQAPAPLSASA